MKKEQPEKQYKAIHIQKNKLSVFFSNFLHDLRLL
jgi:hypothetical protein